MAEYAEAQCRGEWIKTPGGVFVQSRPVNLSDIYGGDCVPGRVYTGFRASRMNPDVIERFNGIAKGYDLSIEETDDLFTRMLKTCELVSRMRNDGSSIPSPKDFFDTLLEIARGKAESNSRVLRTNSNGYLRTLYDMLTESRRGYITNEMLEFVEVKRDGSSTAKRLRFFPERCGFGIVGEVSLPRSPMQSGNWIRYMGDSYPMLTRNVRCNIRNKCTKLNLEPGKDRKGRLKFGRVPVEGERRVVTFAPGDNPDELFVIDLRKSPRPKVIEERLYDESAVLFRAWY